MLVNICCSPSSGSTFLAQLLDQHPQIACGDELWLFCKPLLYDDYPKFRRLWRAICLFGLPGRPYHEYRDIFRHTRGYGMRRTEFQRWASEALDLPSLAGRMGEHVRQVTGKPIWAEKTPWNILVVGRFLAQFPEARMIHIVRDPRDVILSLCRKRRNWNWLRWGSVWTASVAAIQSYRSRPNVLEIRYEDLCTEPEPVLRRVCEFLDVEFSMDYFGGSRAAPSVLTKASGHPGWALRPGGEISRRSVGKYQTGAIDWGQLSELRLAERFAGVLETQTWSATELALLYGYEISEPPREGCEGIDRPLFYPRRLNGLFHWLDRAAGIPAYMPQTVTTASSARSPAAAKSTLPRRPPRSG